jgi:hypothetical protein
MDEVFFDDTVIEKEGVSSAQWDYGTTCWFRKLIIDMADSGKETDGTINQCA